MAGRNNVTKTIGDISVMLNCVPVTVLNDMHQLTHLIVPKLSEVPL